MGQGLDYIGRLIDIERDEPDEEKEKYESQYSSERSRLIG